MGLREPYITETAIRGIKGMADHLGEDLEAYKARHGGRPVWRKRFEAHTKDELGELLGGMKGEIVEGLLTYCLENVGHDPAITKAFKNMIMVARLAAPDDFMEPYNQALAKRQERDRREREYYEQRLREWEAGLKRTIENYHQTQEELNKRWARVLKSLRAAIKKNPDVTTMALEDQGIFQYLNKKGLVTIRGNIILDVDHRLDDASNGLIKEVITKIGLILAEPKVVRWQQGAVALIEGRKPKTRVVPQE